MDSTVSLANILTSSTEQNAMFVGLAVMVVMISMPARSASFQLTTTMDWVVSSVELIVTSVARLGAVQGVSMVAMTPERAV